MPPEEIWRKLRQRGDVHLLRWHARHGKVSCNAAWLARQARRDSPVGRRLGCAPDKAAALHSFFRDRLDLGWITAAANPVRLKERLWDEHPDSCRHIVAVADRICRGEIEIFGRAGYRFPGRFDWHLDCKTSQRWPRRFYADIAYQGPQPAGDVKHAWELSRHQYWVSLGQAFLLTGDEKYCESFLAQASSWLEDNPPFVGIHWISSLECALRVVSWAYAFALCRAAACFSAGTFGADLFASLFAQIRFLERHLSIGRFANNHLVGEAAGLFIGGLWFRGFRGADRWIAKGRQILNREILAQSHPDGVNREQAASYQRFSMDFFLLYKQIHESEFGPLPQVVDHRIHEMFRATASLMWPDGRMPVIGDGDNARGLDLTGGANDDYRELIHLGAVLYDDAHLAWRAECSWPSALWLLGPTAKAPEPLGNAPISGTGPFLLGEGGYAILRDDRRPDPTVVVMDVGPLGHGSGAHGHADALSIQLYAAGEERLVDPGTYAYNREPELRNYFRSTAAHNTATVDGKNQVPIRDRMSWESTTGATLRAAHFDDCVDLAAGEHTGYHRLPDPVTHTRCSLFSKDSGYILLFDDFIASGVHRYDLHFHLAPDGEPSGKNPVHVRFQDGVRLVLACRSAGHTEGGDDVVPKIVPGRHSRRYGEISETAVFRYTVHGLGPVLIASLVSILHGGDHPWRIGRADRFQRAVRVELEHPDATQIWLYNPEEDMVCWADIAFKGLVARIHFPRNQADAGCSVWGHRVSHLAFKGRVVIDGALPASGLLAATIPEEIGI